jgi:hypothetical protein
MIKYKIYKNSHITFIKIKDKYVDGLYDNWYASIPWTINSKPVA